MIRGFAWSLLYTVVVLSLMSCAGKYTPKYFVDYEALSAYDWPDPDRYEEAIAAFEAEDASQGFPENAIVATGSSSMLGWHKSIQEDLAPLTIIPRGFGGSNMYDVYTYTDRLILKYQPRAVMIYEGDNDIARGLPAEAVRDAFLAIFLKVQETQPGTRFYLLAVKPSPSRWDKWPEMQRANEMFAQIAEKDPLITYIDIGTPMLGEDGEPKEDIFLNDDLHMNARGYDIWAETVAPILFETESQYE